MSEGPELKDIQCEVDKDGKGFCTFEADGVPMQAKVRGGTMVRAYDSATITDLTPAVADNRMLKAAIQQSMERGNRG